MLATTVIKPFLNLGYNVIMIYSAIPRLPDLFNIEKLG